ncbi:metallophosphoesterase family protein [Brevibacillus sp. SYSU BS000544]|uniref:metallophosphoesterase family protein n=1 Tax=Brevibacillus sp. SYSU BS000544 TaxID=3416443 RepID=UPI003CE58987
MRIAFLSDIHGNAVALEAVLADIEKQRIDQIYVLGDIAYRGPEPKRSIQLVQSLQTTVIKGNADEWTVRGVQAGEVREDLLEMMNREREWTIDRLDESDLIYLRNLPDEFQLQLTDSLRLHAFHATKESLFDIVLPDASVEQLQTKILSEQAAITVYAHIHLPYVRYMNGKCLINTGSVGLPFDGLPLASYAVVEAENNRYRATIERVPYDLDKVVEQFTSGEYPNAETMIRVIRQAKSPFIPAK